MGTKESADRAFREGFEDHKFNKRPQLTAEAAPKESALPAPQEETQERVAPQGVVNQDRVGV